MDKEKEFQKVLKCLKNNKVVVDTRDDGIYIRLAGRESDGEAFTLHFALAYPFPKVKTKEEVNESKPTEPPILNFNDNDKKIFSYSDVWEIINSCSKQITIDNKGYLHSLFYTEACKQSKSKKEEPQQVEENFKVEGLFLSSAPGKDWVYKLHLNKLMHHEKQSELKNIIERYLNGEMNNPAPKEEPQWEILEYKNTTNGDVFTFQSVCNNSIYSDGFKDNTSEFSRQDCFIIESVKRFPDNTVWSVDGSYFINGYMATLKRFELSENGKMIVYFNGLNIGYELSELPTEKAPKEEQVPIKVEIMEFGYGKPQENKGNFYVANFNLPNNAKLPTEKYQSIKSAIEDVLNEDKIKHEKLLSKIESKVRLANMINTQANYLKETLDYINSLK